MSEQPKSDHTPFREELPVISSEGFVVTKRIHELKSDPNRIVRHVGELSTSDLVKAREFTPRLQKATMLLGELADYGVNVPQFQYIVGKYGGLYTVYCVTEKLNGVDLPDFADNTTNHSTDLLDSLFTSNARYLTDKYKNGGDYLPDTIGVFQYFYGTRPNEQDAKTYLIDLDPWVGHIDSDHKDAGSETSFFEALNYLCKDILNYETNGRKFDTARSLVTRLMSSAVNPNPEETPYLNELIGIDESERTI